MATLGFKEVVNEEEKSRLKNKKEDRKRKARRICWFNPTFSRQVAKDCSVGKKFFEALDACFPK